MRFQVRVVFVFVQKEKKTKKNTEAFGLLYLRNGWYDLLQIWNVACHYRRALPQQIWCSLDKRSRIYECVKITTLLFLLVYSFPFVCAPGLLGLHNTLPCVLISFLKILTVEKNWQKFYDCDLVRCHSYYSV